MTPSNELFLLIKSLSRTEKGYFKKFASRHSSEGNSKYLKIFEEIEKQNSYNEESLKKSIGNEISGKNFPAAKAYLYGIILRSLNSFYISSNKDNELKESLRSIEILYRKALYVQCLRMVKKKKAESYKYDNYLQTLELIRWEKNLIHEGAYSGKEMDNLEKLYEEEQVIINRLKNLSNLRIFSYRISNSVVKEETPEHKAKIKKMLSNPMLADEGMYTSYLERINYNHIKSSLYIQSSDNISSHKHKKRIIELMEENEVIIKDNPVNYIISLSNLLSACVDLNHSEEFTLYLNKLSSIMNTNKDLTENTKVLAFMGEALPLLKMKLKNDTFLLADTALKNIEDGLVKYNGKFNKHDETLCLYLLMVIYFKEHNFEKSLSAVNRILKENDDQISPEAVINTRIFNLLLHYELGNVQLLEHLADSYERYFELREDIDSVQKIILKFFKKLTRQNKKSEARDVIAETKKKLELIKQSHPYISIFEYFDLISYFENKIPS